MRQRDEPASEPPSTSPELRTRPSSRPRAGKNGSHGGALPLPPQRLPRPLQASRTSPACDRAVRLASWSRRASSGALPLRESTRPSAGRRTIFRRRREASLEFPALASERRFARVAGGACAARPRWVEPKPVRSAVQARSDQHSARSVAATESDRWSRDQNGPVAASRLPVAPVSSVPRCSSLNWFTRSDSACPAARHPNRFAADLDGGPSGAHQAIAFVRTRVDGAENASAFERSVTIFGVVAQAPEHHGASSSGCLRCGAARGIRTAGRLSAPSPHTREVARSNPAAPIVARLVLEPDRPPSGLHALLDRRESPHTCGGRGVGAEQRTEPRALGSDDA